MKSFALLLGLIVINFKEELSKAEDKIDWERLGEYSGDWKTCGVGQQSAVIPRGEGGEPEDDLLDTFGSDFSAAIVDEDKEKALNMLALINVRAKQVVKEVLAEQLEYVKDAGQVVKDTEETLKEEKADLKTAIAEAKEVYKKAGIKIPAKLS